MCLEDIKQAIEIDSETFPTVLPPTNYQRELRNEIAFYIVACDGGSDRIIGLAGFWLMAGEAHIVNIAVRGDYQRRGIGEIMLIKLINMALEKGADTITLEVRKSNAAAQKLYQKYNINIKGVRRGYYLDDREDAVIMTAEDIGSGAFKANLARLKKEHYRKWNEPAYNY